MVSGRRMIDNVPFYFRSAAIECLKSVFNNLSADSVLAFMPAINAHLRCAMTHLSDDVKLHSLQVCVHFNFAEPCCSSHSVFRAETCSGIFNEG